MTLSEMVGTNLIRMGAAGATVAAIQLRLKELGAPLRGTGFFGSATDTAVESFQRAHGLKVDGVVGRITATALDLAGTEMPVKTDEISRPLWLQAGMPLIGIEEHRNADEIIEWAEDEGGSIARDYKTTSTAWCSLFENHLLTKAGLKGTETLWALDWNADLMKQRIGVRWPGVQLPDYAVGGIAPMTRAGGGHVITIVGKDKNGLIVGLGGNQNDAVNLRSFQPGRLNRGIWWPESAPPPKVYGLANLPVIRSDGTISTKEG